MRKKFHSIGKRARIRADWNKYNLYNLAQWKKPQIQNKSYFQQKWEAKSISRGYHGEQIKEKHWERTFSRRIPAVAPMDYKYLAEHDGSELAEGRGQGQDIKLAFRERLPQRTPYMEMTYHPIERRLDTSIWRALFASSARQARQFVVHGFVKVNGKKMIHPGYLLNPGDMFQVDPQRVMFATGEKKDAPPKKLQKKANKSEEPPPNELEDEATLTEHTDSPQETTTPSASIITSDTEPDTSTRSDIKSLLKRARDLLQSTKKLSARQKQDLRAFTSTLKTTLARASSKNPTTAESVTMNTTSSLAEQLATIKLRVERSAVARSEAALPTAEDKDKDKDSDEVGDALSEEQERLLVNALRAVRENPVNPAAPYATPWRPRPFMSPFAFIPQYLEVNQNVCAAVYLRHPVARPGLAEVPSPFHPDTSQLTFNWYLRRR